jgi:hypothetical protein
LAGFSEKIVDPEWLKVVEADGHQETGKPPPPASGQEVKAEQAKAKKRRKQKTEAMRRFRARK